MIKLKSQEEIKNMAEGGKILGGILSHLKKKVQEGVTTLEIDQEAEREILAAGGKPSFKMVPNYKFSTCLCVNEVVVHGLPADYELKKGDFLGIDVGLFYKGFHTDMAWTIIVGNQEDAIGDCYSCKAGSGIKKTRSEIATPAKRDQEKLEFLNVGEEALRKAISVAQEGNHIGDISRAIQEKIEGVGYSVVRALVGHGIGQKLHEDPQIPGFLFKAVEKTPRLGRGMTLAIEVIYNLGSSEVVYRDDGWTVVTEDGSLSGLFEKTIAVTEKEPIVLTP